MPLNDYEKVVPVPPQPGRCFSRFTKVSVVTLKEVCECTDDNKARKRHQYEILTEEPNKPESKLKSDEYYLLRIEDNTAYKAAGLIVDYGSVYLGDLIGPFFRAARRPIGITWTSRDPCWYMPNWDQIQHFIDNETNLGENLS